MDVPICETVQKSHLSSLLINESFQMLEGDLRVLSEVINQGCKVCSEEAHAAEMTSQLMEYSIGNAQSIECARTAEYEVSAYAFTAKTDRRCIYPLPNSSRITKVFWVLSARIFLQSSISTLKVD